MILMICMVIGAEIQMLRRIKVERPSQNGGSFNLKGGYIMSRFIAKGLRETSDIDMSVSNKEVFSKVVSKLLPTLEELKSQGEIFSYSIKQPKIEGVKKILVVVLSCIESQIRLMV